LEANDCCPGGGAARTTSFPTPDPPLIIPYFRCHPPLFFVVLDNRAALFPAFDLSLSPPPPCHSHLKRAAPGICFFFLRIKLSGGEGDPFSGSRAARPFRLSLFSSCVFLSLTNRGQLASSTLLPPCRSDSTSWLEATRLSHPRPFLFFLVLFFFPTCLKV